MSSQHYKAHKDVPVSDLYDVGEVIGTGAFSEVKLVTCKQTGEKFAAKIMDRSKDERQMAIITIEIEIFKRVCHENVVKLHEVFETKTHFTLILQLITGGELFESIVKRTKYSEADASKLVKQLLLGLQHLHERGVIHRDLKPENLLLSDDSINANLLLTDFGLSCLADDVEERARAVGTPGYLAPEVLHALDTGEPYTESVDLFGVGVIMYILLCGFPPFFGDDEEEVYVATETCRYDFPKPYWDTISDNAKDLIQNLITKTADTRLTATEALNHPWIFENQSTSHMGETIVQLKKFNAKRKFKGAVKGLIAMDKLRRLSVGNTGGKGGLLSKLKEIQAKNE